ncbi:MAG TPA: acyltransferase, partial [Gemmatimonadaceae bacterium]|nr:acyltransferase [Gemmatimonadaceae bacterium]
REAFQSRGANVRARIVGARAPVTSTTPVAAASSRNLPRHFPALDGLRGVAILLVVVLHGTESLDRVHKVSEGVLTFTNIGFTGVDLFFVLSGFLITGILLDAKGSEGYFRVFYTRRVLRIFPLYYAYLALVFLILPLFPIALPAVFGELRENQIWYWTYLSNVLNAMREGWRIDGAFTTHFWSLAVEEQFYLVWPAVVLALSAKNLRNACLAVIIGTPLLRLGLRVTDVNPVAVYVLTICRADALAMGALVAVMFRRDGERELVRKLALPMLGMSGVTLVGLGVWRGGFGQFDIVVGTLGFSVWAAFYGALLATALLVPAGMAWVPSVFSKPWLRFFGKYSYAIYVFHRPVCGLAEWALPYASINSAVGAIGAGIAFVLAVLVASTAAALLSWWLLESRFIALKDRFPYGRPKAPPSPDREAVSGAA